ncbi:PLIN3 protein, partial [Eubucco bourcierii]|nr:PLIN3 protein [Eubucco bourcierii]
VNEVTNPTLINSACDMVAAAYASTEESHPYIKSSCDAVEKGVKSESKAAATCVQPVLAMLEPCVAAGSEFESKGLDKPGEKLPLLQKSGEQVISEIQEQVTSRGAEAEDAMSS